MIRDLAVRREEFRAIYAAHHAAVCAYFARRTARGEVEDLAAETFTIAWRKLPRRIEHPLPWLYAVAGNVLANHRRKAARRDAAHLPGAVQPRLLQRLCRCQTGAGYPRDHRSATVGWVREDGLDW